MAGLALYTSQGLSAFDRRLAEMNDEEEELLNPFSEGMGFSGSYQDSESPLGAG